MHILTHNDKYILTSPHTRIHTGTRTYIHITTHTRTRVCIERAEVHGAEAIHVLDGLAKIKVDGVDVAESSACLLLFKKATAARARHRTVNE